MVYWLGKLYHDYKIKTINRATVNGLCFAFHYPRSLCKVIALICMVYLCSAILTCLMNLIFVIEFKLKIRYFSSHNIKFYGEVNLIHYKLTDENVNRTIYSLVYQMFLLGVFLFVNMSLLTAATIKRKPKCIVIWLMAHTTHMFYSLSFNIWFGVYTTTMSIILISIFNTMLYLMFIFMVMLFWLSERYSGCRHYRVTINMV